MIPVAPRAYALYAIGWKSSMKKAAVKAIITTSKLVVCSAPRRVITC